MKTLGHARQYRTTFVVSNQVVRGGTQIAGQQSGCTDAHCMLDTCTRPGPDNPGLHTTTPSRTPF